MGDPAKASAATVESDPVKQQQEIAKYIQEQLSLNKGVADANFYKNLITKINSDRKLGYTVDPETGQVTQTAEFVGPEKDIQEEISSGSTDALRNVNAAGPAKYTRDKLLTQAEREDAATKRRFENVNRGLAGGRQAEESNLRSVLESAGIGPNNPMFAQALSGLNAKYSGEDAERLNEAQSAAIADAGNQQTTDIAQRNQGFNEQKSEQQGELDKLAALRAQKQTAENETAPQYQQADINSISGRTAGDQLTTQKDITNANNKTQVNLANTKAANESGPLSTIGNLAGLASKFIPSDQNIKKVKSNTEMKKEMPKSHANMSAEEHEEVMEEGKTPSANPPEEEQVQGGLEMVMQMPVQEWAYKEDSDANDGGQKHIGTMAQNFKAATGVGTGKEIDVTTMLGVLTKAVQELNQKVDSSAKVEGTDDA